MLRSLLLGATAAVTISTTAAMADNKSDCQNGVAMIEAELKKEHSEVVLEALRKVLSIAELKVEDQAWSECIKYIKVVRDVLTGAEGNDQAKASDKERAASDKPSCEQGRYWCAKRAGCIKTGTQRQYLQGNFGEGRLERH